MSTNLPGSNPTAYLGIKERNPSELHFRDRAPTAADAGPYDKGDTWIDEDGEEAYILIKKIGPVATWVGMAGAGALETLTADAGGAVSPDGAENINVLGGTGVSIIGTPGTNTLTVNATGSGMAWVEVVGASQAMSSNTGYIANNAALVTLTLPVVAAVGDVINIVGKGAGLYSIAQNAGQVIHFSSQDTTVGAGGSAAATLRYDAIEIVCSTANNEWTVFSAIGNFTIN